jgi:hypothetical protein
MPIADEVRRSCAAAAAHARQVRIDAERLAALDPPDDGVPPAGLDPERHFLDGSEEDVARYLLALDAINFGSGWFPQLRKRPGCSGYFTVAWALADRFRADGPWTSSELRTLRTDEIAATLGQPADLELMSLYAQALRQLGHFLGGRRAVDLVAEARGSAQRLASIVASGMSMWNDRGFFKRAQILPNDLALAGIAKFGDLDELTIFADNVVPHVLRCEGVLVYEPALAGQIDAGRILTDARAEREIRACAVHACAQLSARLGVPECVLDVWLWNRGQEAEYKARPRHRARSVFY